MPHAKDTDISIVYVGDIVVKGLKKPTWTTSATTVFTYDEAA